MASQELEIYSMAHGGSGIGRIDGRVVFCPDVIPGEIVEVEIVDDRKSSYWMARALKIIKPSPERRNHIWPEADISLSWKSRVGGSNFGHIELSHQRKIKTQVLKNCLERYGQVPQELLKSVHVRAVHEDIESNGLGWRTRVKLHSDKNGRLGQLAEKTRTVIPVSTLPLATKGIAESGALRAKYRPGDTVRICDTGSGLRMLVNDQPPQDIVETVGDLQFNLSDRSFWQVHYRAPTTLLNSVRRAVDQTRYDPEAPNFDLYAGVGLFGAALKSISSERMQLTAVESDLSAAKYLESNLKTDSELTVVSEKVERWLRAQLNESSKITSAGWKKATVILDPPRAGAKKQVLSPLEELRPTQIIYVACDPMSLARDSGLLTEAGYELVSLEAWDLFPHTHHMEIVASFQQR